MCVRHGNVRVRVSMRAGTVWSAGVSVCWYSWTVWTTARTAIIRITPKSPLRHNLALVPKLHCARQAEVERLRLRAARRHFVASAGRCADLRKTGDVLVLGLSCLHGHRQFRSAASCCARLGS